LLARRFTVIGHGHPRRSELASRYRRAGIEHVASFSEVCRRASIYVADNTSTLFEFAATGRPVVVLNARRYRRDVRHGLRFWDAAGVGPNVDRPRDLPDVVARALEDPPEFREKREAPSSSSISHATAARSSPRPRSSSGRPDPDKTEGCHGSALALIVRLHIAAGTDGKSAGSCPADIGFDSRGSNHIPRTVSYVTSAAS
jgi:hypothetical protein